jgi:hypothetical protein
LSQFAATTAVTGSVGGTSAALVGENPGRRELTVTNTHATQTLQINLATAKGVAPTAVIGSSHIYLAAAGGSWTTVQWKGACAIIGSGAGTTYALMEF